MMREDFPTDHLVISAILHHGLVTPAGWDKVRWVDDEGRPLIESHAPDELCAAAGMELRPCPYKDSRFHHERPMNVSALQQVRRHWDSTKAIYLGLRSLLRTTSDPSPLTVRELWRLSYLAFSVPPYLGLSAREHGPVLPSWAAALFKTGLGLTPLTVMVFESQLAGGADAVADGKAVLDLADSQGTLIGPRHVCAGPPRMIVEILDFVIEPPADAFGPTFDDLLDDSVGFRSFGLQLLDACTACYLFFLARQYLTGDLHRALVGTPDFDRYKDQLAALERVEVDPNVYPYIDVLDEVTDSDKRDLLTVIGELVDDPDLQALGNGLAEQWVPTDDEHEDDVVARLLVIAVRLERCFLAMLESAEARLRTALGHPPFNGALDHHYVDRLYPAHPRRLLCELRGVDVEISPTAATIRR